MRADCTCTPVPSCCRRRRAWGSDCASLGILTCCGHSSTLVIIVSSRRLRFSSKHAEALHPADSALVDSTSPACLAAHGAAGDDCQGAGGAGAAGGRRRPVGSGGPGSPVDAAGLLLGGPAAAAAGLSGCPTRWIRASQQASRAELSGGPHEPAGGELSAGAMRAGRESIGQQHRSSSITVNKMQFVQRT